MISISHIVKIEDTEKKILKITAEFVKFHSYSFLKHCMAKSKRTMKFEITKERKRT